MTMETSHPLYEPAGHPVFSFDMPVLERIAADSGNGRSVARFGDDVWDLSPLTNESTDEPVRLNFAAAPEKFRESLKRLMYCLINRPLPRGMLHRSTGALDDLAPRTYLIHLYQAIDFARVLDEHDIGRLCDAGDTEFQVHRDRQGARHSDPNVVNKFLFYITRCSLYGEYLPVEDRIPLPPWDKRSTRRTHVGSGGAVLVNRTPAIDNATMEVLLVWALRWVEDFSGDILRAAAAREVMEASIPNRVSPGDRAKAIEGLEQFRRADRPLPGMSFHGTPRVALKYLAATLGFPRSLLQTILQGAPWRDMPVRIGAPIEDIAIEGRIDGKPWVESIDFYEVDTLVSLLATACMVTTAYLSGMRSKEARALERGCMRRIDASRESPERFEVWGRVFKGVRDSQGKAIREGRMRDDPWWVAEEVHTALSILERLHPHKLLFCPSAFHPRGSGENNRIIRAAPLNDAIARFVEWCNASAAKLALPGNEIPADSNGRITMRRFRQTIGRDIAEAEEAGENVVMALNRQFDHRAIAQTMAYMGSGDEGTSLLEEQRVLAAHDRQHARAEALAAGLTVSGAAKEPLIARVKEHVLRFPGTVLTQRELDRIRKDGRLPVHDDRNQMCACVYDGRKALCLNRGSNPEDGPRFDHCQSGCANIARDDHHIELVRQTIARLKQEMPYVPEPLRNRMADEVTRLEAIVAEHEQNGIQAREVR